MGSRPATRIFNFSAGPAVLPEAVLEQVADRDLVPVLARQAAILREEPEYLDALAGAAWPGECPSIAGGLRALEPVLARRAVRRWLGVPPPSSAEVDRVLEVARGIRRATELAGGRVVRRSAGVLAITAD